MQKMKLVVVGNGMAGMRVVEELLKIAPDIYDITVFGDEPYQSQQTAANHHRVLMRFGCGNHFIGIFNIAVANHAI